jgi:hypothetical protein
VAVSPPCVGDGRACRDDRYDLRVKFRRVTPLLRPPRLAIGVEPDTDSERWAGLIANACATWGGLAATVYFPLDGWRRGGLWDVLLDRFDPDIFVFAGDFAHGEIIKDRYGPLHTLSDPEIYFGSGPLTGHAVALANVLRVDPPKKPHHVSVTQLANAPEWLRLGVYRERGLLTAEDEARFAQAGVQVQQVHYDLEVGGEFVDGVAAAVRPTPASVTELSRIGLMVVSPIGPVTRHPIVVCGSTAADIALWLTLRAYRNSNDVYWVPAQVAGALHTDPVTDRYLRIVSAAVHELPPVAGPPRIFLTSTSMQFDVVAAVADAIRAYIPNPPHAEVLADIVQHLGTRGFAAITRHEGAYIEQFTEGRAHRMVSLKWPDWLDDSPDAGVSFLVELHVEQFSALNHQAAPPYFVDRLSDEDQRGSRYGIVADFRSPVGFLGDQLHHALQLRQLDLPTALDLAGRLARHLDGRVELSDAGRLCREVATRFGGLREAAQGIVAVPLAGVLKEYLLPINPANKRAGRLEIEGRWVIGSRLFAEILAGLEQEPEAYLKTWTEQHVIEWGLALQCDHCRHSAFFRWTELGRSTASCKRCGRSFQVDPPSAANWVPVARLDELVQQALHRDVTEELWMAETLLRDARGWEVIPGIEWQLPGLTVETDLIGAVDGDLVLGEAKSTTEFSDASQPARLGHLASRLEARRLVFATSAESWQPTAIKRFRAVKEAHPGLEVVAWTKIRSASGPTRVSL